MKKLPQQNAATSKPQFAVSFQKTISQGPNHLRFPSTALESGYRPEVKFTTVNTEVNMKESDIIETLPS